MKHANISAEYMCHHGSDLLVANSARVSFNKESEYGKDGLLKEEDRNLIKFLATGYRSKDWELLLLNIKTLVESGDSFGLTQLLKSYKRKAQHFAPFAHPHVTIRIHLPIFLARQFVKHQVGGVWSEESRRYINTEPEVWEPDDWHCRPKDVKQGSGETLYAQELMDNILYKSTSNSLNAYKELLGEGVAPEEARILLPLNMMTNVVWTGSLLFWSRVYNQRSDSHAQLAAQELAHAIGLIMQPLFPVSWEELTN